MSTVMEEITDLKSLPKRAGATASDLRSQQRPWLCPCNGSLPGHRGKCICNAGEELFVADTPEQGIALVAAAHPEDDGSSATFPRKNGSQLCELTGDDCCATTASCALVISTTIASFSDSLRKLYKKTFKSRERTKLKVRKPTRSRVKARNWLLSLRQLRQSLPDSCARSPKRSFTRFAPANIILVRFYAYGKPTSDSDLDLLIVMESRDRPAERIRKLSDLLTPAHCPWTSSSSPLARCGTGLGGFDPLP